MSDKMRSGFPIEVNFYDGEMPTGAKMRGLARQAKNGISLLEYAVGDLWNQSGDDLLTNGGTSTANALMIANLSRFIGAAKETNPRYPSLPYLENYTHKFYSGDGYVGTREGMLSVLPDSGATYTWSGTGAPSSLAGSQDEVNATGKYYVETSTGRCFFYDTIASDWKASYTPNTSAIFEQGDGYSFNVIPDPDTHTSYGFRGCKIAYYNNTDSSQGYIIYLPPRGPLKSTRTLSRAPQSPYDSSANTDNVDSTPTTGSRLYWQSSSVAATTDATAALHYRYLLPTAITDYWSNASPLPTGLVWLWDHSQTQTIIEGLTVTAEPVASPSEWAFIVSGASMDTWIANYGNSIYPAGYLTAKTTHTSTYYPANGLRVITTGNSLSKLVGLLYKKFFEHNHGDAYTKTNLANQPVSHSSLIDCFALEGELGERYNPSALPYDYHPQYLHRQGYSASIPRDLYGNGMFGDLLMLSTNSGTYYQNLSASSRGIIFGHPTLGPKIWYDGSRVRISQQPIRMTGGYLEIENDDQLGTVPWLALRDRNLLSNDGVRLVAGVAADGIGSLTIENYDATFNSKEDGSVHCSRYYGGTTDDTNYGYSGGYINEYGPIRKFIIPPQDFVQFNSNTTEEVSVSNESLVTTDIFRTCGDGSSGPAHGVYAVEGRLAAPTALNSVNYAFAYIKIPYRHYAIVNVQIDICHNITVGFGRITTGYEEWQDMGINGLSARSICNALSADFTDFCTGDGVFNGLVNIISPYTGSPEIVVDNATPDTYDVRIPWVRLRTEGDGNPGKYVLFRPVIVLYRVKEY